MAPEADAPLAQETLRLARTLWDYHHLGHELVQSDVITVLGSHDLRVADRGAELFLAGWAPRIVFSGGRGRLTEGWAEPEAAVFAARAVEHGVPRERILTEERSTNTGENVLFTRDLLAREGLPARRWLLVHKPYMERRAFATFRRYVPGAEVCVTSLPCTLEEYAPDRASRESLVHLLVGDTQRIIEYPARGYSIAQEVPEDVRDAYLRLVELGYDDHLI